MEISQSTLKKCEVACMEISQSPLKKDVNWLELPREVTLTILMKLGHLEILQFHQFVCKLWHRLCKDPFMWRTVSFKYIVDETMMFDVVDRSAGGLIDVDMERFGSDKLCSYIASRSSQLKRLRLANCRNISAKIMIESLEKLSLLEELELTLCSFKAKENVTIINTCPSLTTFKLNGLVSSNQNWPCNEEALAIAGNMPKLRHLQLIGNKMTNDGLTAILDGCPHLQVLDLRVCLQPDLVGNLKKRLSANIKDLRLPHDSTEDYGYPTLEVYSSDDDIGWSLFDD